MVAPARPQRLAAGCAIFLGLVLTACLGSALLVGAWFTQPLLYGSADFVYACAGVNLQGRFRFGFGWVSNLANLTPVLVSLPKNVCGYYPRPPFLAPDGSRIFQP